MTSAHDFDTRSLFEAFDARFGASARKPRLFHAPGRVNLVGDHTDYTGGLVFPCGIDRGTYLLARLRDDGRFRFASTNFDLAAELDHDGIARRHDDSWFNYPLGVLDQLTRLGLAIDGVECLFSGNVPNGAGLSSSASLEVVTALALCRLGRLDLPKQELAHVAQRAENEFVGMRCGIMDQFAVTMAERGHAMLLDCHTLVHRQVPLGLAGYEIVVVNTNHRRELNDSAYNRRVEECARALARLREHMELDRLGGLTPDALEALRGHFDDDPVAYRRARHVASENQRVRDAVPLLEAEDLEGFGRLMNASHASLVDDYAVSSEPLDTLVALARARPGVHGSRLTGAGFGGCTVSLVPTAGVEAFREHVGPAYREATGLQADFITIRPEAGVMELDA